MHTKIMPLKLNPNALVWMFHEIVHDYPLQNWCDGFGVDYATFFVLGGPGFFASTTKPVPRL